MTDFIFFYQSTVSAIKFRKRLTKLRITIVLPKKFGSKGCITAVLQQLKSLRFEEALANLISLYIFIPYEVRRGTSTSRKGKSTISKSKTSRLA